MPKGDGTGPPRDPAQRGGRKKGNQPGAGPGGDCYCPQCNTRVTHERGTPCYDVTCPKCGAKMLRG